MGALQELQVIHVATHDSIGTGEDGPTHQPIELAALYRAMPNLLYIRPCDSEETAGAFKVALQARQNSTIISTSRQNLPQYKATKRDAVKYGAYVFREREDATVTMIGVGAEFSFAVEAAEDLEKDGIRVRIVSFPCQRLFEQQSREYRRATLQGKKTVAVVVEAYAANGWERYANAGFSMKSFGKSLPGKEAYKYFGFDGKVISGKIKAYLEDLKHERIWKDEFVEL
jgi:dihydroxyacetone synthase